METKYIIGVDGGGTKMDYLIFTTEGELVDSLHVGSRSHEVLRGGFVEVEEIVIADIENLLKKNSIKKTQIMAAAFGMAGIDTPAQLVKMFPLQVIPAAGAIIWAMELAQNHPATLDQRTLITKHIGLKNL